MGSKRGDEPIICKVCLSVYDEGPRVPLTLHCRHTFCATCIADSLMTPEDRTKVFCPLCRSKTNLGKAGIAGLPVNEVSVELVRAHMKRKQPEQMQVSQMMARTGSQMAAGRRSQFVDDVPRQMSNQVASANPLVEPGKPRGILKVRNKQNRLERPEFQVVGQQKQFNQADQVTGSSQYIDQSTGDNIPLENGIGNGVIPDHSVVVKSSNRLHPPPHRTQFESMDQLDQQEPLNGHEASDEALDVSQIGLQLPDGEGHGFIEGHVDGPVLTDTFASRPPDFLRPISESADPRNIVPDTTPDPYRFLESGGEDAHPTPNPTGRIYPVGALLHMATAEGIPRDQIGSVDPDGGSVLSGSSNSLTDSQRLLPPSAKYGGRFGKYSERPQPGALNSPGRVACSIDGTRLAVTDRAWSAVHVFSSKGEYVSSFQVPDVMEAVCFLVDNQFGVVTARGLQLCQANGAIKKTLPIAGVVAVAAFRQGFVAASRNRVSVCKSLVGSVIHSINGKRDAGRTHVPFDDVVDIAVSTKDELCILETRVVLITDEEGVIKLTIQPDLQSPCGPFGRAAALAVCPADRSFVVYDEAHRRVLLFGPDGAFAKCLVNLGRGAGPEGENITGMVVSKSNKLFAVVAGGKMAEIRVFLV